jgi:hypothetical protein
VHNSHKSGLNLRARGDQPEEIAAMNGPGRNGDPLCRPIPAAALATTRIHNAVFIGL